MDVGRVTDAVRSGTSRAVEYLGLSVGALFILFVSMMVLLYVMYHLYNIIMRTNLKTNTLLQEPVRTPNGETKTLAGNGNFSDLTNGKEFSYGFWMYIQSITNTSNHKHILSRGNNPAFFLDKTQNKLYAVIALRDGAELNVSHVDSGYQNADFITMTIDYVPVQRWVHIALVIENEFATLFMDGEIYGVTNMANLSNGSRVVATSSGDMIIGTYESNVMGFDGALSKIQFFNYALTVNHVRQIYQASPVSGSALSTFGLPLYGIRSPFYKINTVQDINTL